MSTYSEWGVDSRSFESVIIHINCSELKRSLSWIWELDLFDQWINHSGWFWELNEPNHEPKDPNQKNDSSMNDN